MCRTLHKLGEGKYNNIKSNFLCEGGFGVVRAAKILTEAPNKPTKYLGIPGRQDSGNLSTDADSSKSPPSND
jgi:hypothetical protein